MKTILICNQKGGTGKSTICDELAYSLERTGTPYSLYDLDMQGSLNHEQRENPEAEVMIIDTPGALQDDLGAWMQMADLIIIPTLPSSRDIAPLQTMLNLVENKRAAVMVVINHYNPNYIASQAFYECLTQDCTYDTVTIPYAQSILQAAMAGKSIVEYAPRHKAAQSVMDLVNRVRTHVGIVPEQFTSPIQR